MGLSQVIPSSFSLWFCFIISWHPRFLSSDTDKQDKLSQQFTEEVKSDDQFCPVKSQLEFFTFATRFSFLMKGLRGNLMHGSYIGIY